MAVRSLIVVLGDQLDRDAAVFDGFDPARDAVWMAEVAAESTHVWSTKQRIAQFLAAMRHFARDIQASGKPLHYVRLDAEGNRTTLAAELQAAVERLRPQRLLMTAPGDWRVWQDLKAVAQRCAVPLFISEDRLFYGTVREFAAHAQGRKMLRMEFFYREQRRRHQVLMDGDQPAGGRWNLDPENRESFGAAGPGALPPRPRFEPDAVTREVLALIDRQFGEHPGTTDGFDWPVTPAQASVALARFIEDRLPRFGQYQDAMWTGEPWLLHAQISSALNLKLLDPRDAVTAAERAWHERKAPLASVEGFIRQILGWREYIRGIYWTRMPALRDMNALDAHEPLPAWFWTGDTDRECLRQAIGQTLAHGYAHHIQRLMVTGLYPLLLGVEPRQVHEWYLAVYVDAVEWVELPNTLGMSQYADDGMTASKPYIASGKYIDRMSNYCKGCRFDPAKRTGDEACPFTTLYWDFLARHEARFGNHQRLKMQVRNLARIDAAERRAIAERAQAIRDGKV